MRSADQIQPNCVGHLLCVSVLCTATVLLLSDKDPQSQELVVYVPGWRPNNKNLPCIRPGGHMLYPKLILGSAQNGGLYLTTVQGATSFQTTTSQGSNGSPCSCGQQLLSCRLQPAQSDCLLGCQCARPHAHARTVACPHAHSSLTPHSPLYGRCGNSTAGTFKGWQEPQIHNSNTGCWLRGLPPLASR